MRVFVLYLVGLGVFIGVMGECVGVLCVCVWFRQGINKRNFASKAG